MPQIVRALRALKCRRCEPFSFRAASLTTGSSTLISPARATPPSRKLTLKRTHHPWKLENQQRWLEADRWLAPEHGTFSRCGRRRHTTCLAGRSLGLCLRYEVWRRASTGHIATMLCNHYKCRHLGAVLNIVIKPSFARIAFRLLVCFHRASTPPDLAMPRRTGSIPSILSRALQLGESDSDSWKLLLNPCTKTTLCSFFSGYRLGRRRRLLRKSASLIRPDPLQQSCSVESWAAVGSFSTFPELLVGRHETTNSAKCSHWRGSQ